jgi:hypothetical protein
MKTKLFIDFDGTLFDTKCYKAKIFAVFLELGFSEEEIEKSYYDECQGYLYNPKRQAKRLDDIKHFNLDLAKQKLDALHNSVQECIFPDSEDFLKTINREKYEVVLLTLGDEEFQRSKFENSGLEKYFDKTLYPTIQKWDYLEDIVKENEKFIIIDDRGDTCAKISTGFVNVTAIEINRKTTALDPMEPKDEFGGIKVNNLDEANKYL